MNRPEIPAPARGPSPGLDRRLFLRGTGLTLTALLAGSATDRQVLARQTIRETLEGSCPRFGIFDDETFMRLEAVAEQIVPADGDPGAGDFCSASFVEAIAAGDPATANLLSDGLKALEGASQELFGQAFVDLPFGDQTHLLRLVEAGTAPGDWDGVGGTMTFAEGEAMVPEEIRSLLRKLDRTVPTKHILGGMAAPVFRRSQAAPSGATSGASATQQMVFATFRSLCKLAFVLNFPEMSVRGSDGTPIFSDAEHLISDPDDPATLTGWTVVGYHEIDYQVEKLMWEWQAGYRVVGFDGVPILDGSAPLSESERLIARDLLYSLSDQGLA